MTQVSPGAARNSLTQDSPGDHTFRNLQEQVPPVYNAFLISWKASRLLDGVNSPFPFFGCRSFPGREKRASSFQHVTKTKLDIVRQFIFERVELSH